jgi:hypothetical protein
MRLNFTILAGSALTCTIRMALAQEPPPEPAPVPAPPTAYTTAPAPPAPVMPAPSEQPRDEHEQFVHHLAIGYLGVATLPIAASGAPNSPPQAGTVNAPVIGVRYWFSRRVGLDAGLGLGLLTGSEQPTSFGGAIHAGLPLALAHATHYTFEIIPEATTGFTTGNIAIPTQNNANVGGFLVKVGVRAGAEIHFGFIGIPQLALQATIGLYYSYQSISWNQNGNATSGNAHVLTTSVDAAPWAIFTNSITALYYL